MSKKNKSSYITRFIIDMSMIAFSLFKTVPDLIFLVQYEAKKAGRSLFYLILFLMMAWILLISTWFSILVILGLYLVSLHLNIFAAVAIIITINIVLLFIIMRAISRAKTNMSFKRTRHLIRKLK